MEQVQRGVEELAVAVHRLALATTPEQVQQVALAAVAVIVGADGASLVLHEGEDLVQVVASFQPEEGGPTAAQEALLRALAGATALALDNLDLKADLERVAGHNAVVQQLEQEIEEHWRFAAEVFHQSVTDELTGLYNRRGFVKRAEQELAVLREAGRPGLCLFLDLDGLKELNDSAGHDAGDELLKQAAQLLRRLFREHDVLARIGGDEFAVFVPGYADVERVVGRLRDQTGPVRMSIGAAVFDPALPRSLYDLLGEADAEMYGDKRARRPERERTG